MLSLMMKHWKLVSAIAIALLIASTVSLSIFFFPPLIPLIATLSIGGFTPFAALAAMPLTLASNIITLTAGASFLFGAFLFNQATRIANFIDNKAQDWANSFNNNMYDIYEDIQEEESEVNSHETIVRTLSKNAPDIANRGVDPVPEGAADNLFNDPIKVEEDPVQGKQEDPVQGKQEDPSEEEQRSESNLQPGM